MDNTIQLREAVVSEIEQIKAILFGALREYGIEIPDSYSVSDIDSIDRKNSIEKVYLLLRQEAAIGFFVLKPIRGDCIELKRLYLTASERGQKLGEYLLGRAIHYAIKHKFSNIRIETSSRFQEAVSLYKKHGFQVLAEVEMAPGHDLVFEKSL